MRVDDGDERDWIFDFLLSVFRSPQWDAAVMGFIDENCTVFDNDEENKLSYTTLHDQFKDLIEILCASSLAEVGVALEDFIQALSSSRLSQDISTAVYEQLMALNDFVTFKKLMVKRNTELELEALQALQDQGVPFSSSSDRNCGADTKEEDIGGVESVQAKTGKEEGNRPGFSDQNKELREAMDINLQELELMHKREEKEQAELEQAIAMSLALERERIKVAAHKITLD
ncbi:unnamed protein product, partial [Choristocarpus tenellus]